ncbi:MAG: hypothetical protein K0S23_3672 [Fluviicola sp.]|jgi:hypothetical protein|uniref:hypothetical protein n=1 Tax=Fluviicola sp. TaxID=1917219 RepID=UPI002619DDF1|nr:hypothetical protein [Fluviicola sp.]MDF3029365.1 hypothetical protein [Fluviicola sp.]
MENLNEFTFKELSQVEMVDVNSIENLKLFSHAQTIVCGVLRYDRDEPREDGGFIFYYTAIGNGTLECVLSINGQVTSTATKTIYKGEKWIVGVRPNQVHGWVCH